MNTTRTVHRRAFGPTFKGGGWLPNQRTGTMHYTKDSFWGPLAVCGTNLYAGDKHNGERCERCKKALAAEKREAKLNRQRAKASNK